MSATQYAANTKNTGVPKMRRRRLILLFTLAIGVLLYLFAPWGIPSISRANMGQLMRTKNVAVDEIYGLLHVVTGDNEQEHVLSKADLDPTVPLALSVYAPENPSLNWRKEKASIDEIYPVVVFSKTYCPYSKRAKELLESYNLQPPPKIIEVDLRDDGLMIKHLLTRLTQHATFPNILLGGKSIGGSDRLQQLHADGTLKTSLEGAGAHSD